jgi:ferredoxin
VKDKAVPDTSSPLKYRPLRPQHPLGIIDDACLPLRAPRYATCRACEDVCPPRAIHVGDGGLRLDESCVACGRCAAACPMGALGLPGFTLPEPVQKQRAPLADDCWKVPAKLTPEHGMRVPCLGGLSSGSILEIVADAGNRPVELLDRGWCAGCSAGGPDLHPARMALKRACELLEAAGAGPDRLPRLRDLHLPANLMPAAIPAAVGEATLSRRSFFSALTAKATLAVDQIRPLPGGEVRRRRGFEREPVLSRERDRMLGALQRITQGAWLSPPPGLFHRVEVNANCANHQVCASICPTGALAVYEQGRRSELMFDTTLCIGCGECQSVCPSAALQLLPKGYAVPGASLPDRPTPLVSFAERSCVECGRDFADHGEESLCPQCRKRRNLAGSAFRTLFG